MNTTRYAPAQEFPAYAFLPGRDPHPTRDPRGHSYSEKPETPVAHREPNRWRENEIYLYGVDLYNHGYLWEAHEAWEALWHAAKHDETNADFLQGLIQCAAACLKIAMEQPAGLAKLSSLGVSRLNRVSQAAGPDYMGLDLVSYTAAMTSFADSEPESPEGRPLIHLEL